MSLLPRIRAEVAGAWRSVGYDLGRRPSEPDPGTGPDVTSTGMNTFPGSLLDLPMSQPVTNARPPRRFVAVTAFCALAAVGAGGSYVAATTLFAEATPAVTQAAPGPDEATGGLVSPRRPDERSGKERRGSGPDKVSDAMGSVPMAAGRPRTATPAGPGRAGKPATTRAARTAPPVAVKPAPTTPAGRRTIAAPPRATRSATPECDCLTPPVPTPTSLPESPAAPSSPSPATSPAMPSATPGRTAMPSPDAGSSSRASGSRHRWHHRPAAG